MMRFLIILGCLSVVVFGLESCGGGEPTTREKLMGMWQLANPGYLKKFYNTDYLFRDNELKTSFLIFKQDSIIGLRKVGGTTRKEAALWSLNESEEYLHIEAIAPEPTEADKLQGEKPHFINDSKIWFTDERTLFLESKSIVFQFKKISDS